MDRKELGDAAQAWALEDTPNRATFYMGCEMDSDDKPHISTAMAGENNLIVGGLVGAMLWEEEIYETFREAVDMYQRLKKIN